jgi:hypothetical protein
MQDITKSETPVRPLPKYNIMYPVPEIIDPVFAETSQNARFLLSENERFGLVFVKTGSINSGTVDELERTVKIPLGHEIVLQGLRQNLQPYFYKVVVNK